jgi:hypothetical protein
MENSEETSVHDQEEMELAEEIIDGRKCANAKNLYRRKFEHFRIWVVEKYPECAQTDGNTVNLATLSKKHLQDIYTPEYISVVFLLNQ